MMTSQEKAPWLVWKNNKGRADPAFIVSGHYHIAGVLNITPDSFSDGAAYFDENMALDQAFKLIKDGADSLDIGAESTRPGCTEIGAAEEQKRLLPVLKKLNKKLDKNKVECIIAVDTFRAATAKIILEEGLATVINDVSGAMLDKDMLSILAEHKPGYVLGHCPISPEKMQKNIHYENVVEELYAYFSERIESCVRAGLPEENIALDPCIGFAKNLEHNLALMRGVSRFKELGRPLYYGISRKSYLKDFTLNSVEDRDTMTQIAISFLAMQGVEMHRVHNVAMARRTFKLLRALINE